MSRDTDRAHHFLFEAAEHIRLFYVLSDAIRKKEEQLVLRRWVDAGLTVSLFLFQFDIKQVLPEYHLCSLAYLVPELYGGEQ